LLKNLPALPSDTELLKIIKFKLVNKKESIDNAFFDLILKP